MMTRDDFDKRLRDYAQAVLYHHRPGPWMHSTEEMQRMADDLWHDMNKEKELEKVADIEIAILEAARNLLVALKHPTVEGGDIDWGRGIMPSDHLL